MPPSEKSIEQRLASALTFAKKQSLIAVLGLTFCDPDPDEDTETLSSAAATRALVYAGLFLVAYELIRNLVVAPVKRFYDKTTFAPGMPFRTYEDDVLSRHKDVFEASLLYLRDHFKALTPEQVSAIQDVRRQRNSVAHALSKQLSSLDPLVNENLLTAARDALFSLSNHWTYVEIGCDPEFADLDPDWTQVCGEDLTLLDFVIEKTRDQRRIASGDDG